MSRPEPHPDYVEYFLGYLLITIGVLQALVSFALGFKNTWPVSSGEWLIAGLLCFAIGRLRRIANLLYVEFESNAVRNSAKLAEQRYVTDPPLSASPPPPKVKPD